MKKHYVYELYNLMGTVEYVGQTYNPKRRFREHTKSTPNGTSTKGLFYKRTDIFMNIAKCFDNIKDANLFEGKLKLYYGMNWSEMDRCKKTGSITGKLNGLASAIKKSKPVLVYNAKTDELVGEYYSCIEASRVLNLPQASANRVVNKQQIQTKGYKIYYK